MIEIPHAPELQKEFDDLLSECEVVKGELFALPSCCVTVGQLMTLADLELFGLSVLRAERGTRALSDAQKLLADFKRLRGEIIR